MKYVNKNEINWPNAYDMTNIPASEIVNVKIHFSIRESQVFEFYARCFIFTILIMCNLVI
jgi:hypothetical protein